MLLISRVPLTTKPLDSRRRRIHSDLAHSGGCSYKRGMHVDRTGTHCIAEGPVSFESGPTGSKECALPEE